MNPLGNPHIPTPHSWKFQINLKFSRQVVMWQPISTNHELYSIFNSFEVLTTRHDPLACWGTLRIVEVKIYLHMVSSAIKSKLDNKES